MKKLITVILFSTICLSNSFSQVEWFKITSFNAKNVGYDWIGPVKSDVAANLDVQLRTFIIYSEVRQSFIFDKVDVNFTDKCRSYSGYVKDMRNKTGYMSIKINSDGSIIINFKCSDGEMKCTAKFK